MNLGIVRQSLYPDNLGAIFQIAHAISPDAFFVDNLMGGRVVVNHPRLCALFCISGIKINITSAFSYFSVFTINLSTPVNSSFRGEFFGKYEGCSHIARGRVGDILRSGCKGHSPRCTGIIYKIKGCALHRRIGIVRIIGIGDVCSALDGIGNTPVVFFKGDFFGKFVVGEFPESFCE